MPDVVEQSVNIIILSLGDKIDINILYSIYQNYILFRMEWNGTLAHIWYIYSTFIMHATISHMPLDALQHPFNYNIIIISYTY